jgi:ATP-dependent 26S proteasome regulatory subunit
MTSANIILTIFQILDACDALGGCIVFIDEVDALAPSRGGAGGNDSSHEVSRRILSVLLQRLEGFQGRSKNIIICATNRKQDLDAALISRFNVIVRFDLPDLDTRSGLFSAYAAHLSAADARQLAGESAGMSCRGIKDVCEQTERVVASRIINKMRSQKSPIVPMTKLHPGDLPTREDYVVQLDKYKSGHLQGQERETSI